MTVKFFAPGVPRTKGSLRFVPSKFGGKAVPKKDEKKEAWQGTVRTFALAAMQGPPIADAVTCHLFFYFPRPAGHFGTGRNAGVLKKSAPNYPTSRRCGDLDKLERAILDACTGVVWTDDSNVCHVIKSKRFRDVPGVDVVVDVLD